MDSILVPTIITLSATGVIAAVILFFVAQKFKVYEDPNIDLVEAALPGANCGGCGYAGCRNFGESIVKNNSLEGLYCPVGGNECMAQIAIILGMEATAQEAKVAVVRCSGTPECRPKTNQYDGALNCQIAHNLYMGEGGCANGCLGCGDCVAVCKFDAIFMNDKTKLPEVIDAQCTACGACVTACPRNIIELRKKAAKDRKIFVSCINTDKGALAKKNCSVACIGCGKCVKACPYEAITLNNNLAYIDAQKCKLCRKCVTECPTGSILEINFPVRKEKTETKEETNQPIEA